MFWFVYNVLFAVGYTLMLPRFLFRMWRRGGYLRGFLQRFGRYSADVVAALQPEGRLWVHAVSVGEVLVALRFMREIRAVMPGCGFVLTTTTSTGHRVAEAALEKTDVLLYFPSDFPPFVRRALDAIRPAGILLTECEIWPNLVRQAERRGIPVVLINGRISQSSYKGYRLLRIVFRPVLRSMALLLVQDREDGDRLRALGADATRVEVAGSAKYDVAEGGEEQARLGRQVLAAVGIDAACPIVVGGSTWPGEEAVLLDVLLRIREKTPSVKLVLVPRHAERAAEVEKEIRRRGLDCIRRSRAPAGGPLAGPGPDVLLVDTTGEIKQFYACATVVFVGKSLTRHGGQNMIEPALFGKPVVVGPNMENFPGVMRDFLDAQAIVQVQSADALEEAIVDLLHNRERREALGTQAASTVERCRGAVRTSAERIAAVLSP